MMRNIQKLCGFPFPSKAVTNGMVVYICKRRKDDSLGDMHEWKPLRFNLYVSKSETWKDARHTIAHELIHCIVWQKFYYDLRTGKPTFLADIFADELVASVMECLVHGQEPTKRNCREAIEYAFDEAIDRLSRSESEDKLVRAL